MLSERQQQILESVVDDYLQTGAPVGSKSIAERLELEWGPSTIRAELANLERLGLLTHPHTSAGRIPTDSGYRLYADSLLVAGLGARSGPTPSLDLSRMRREVDEAMRVTTAALSRMTDLLALVTAPAPSAAHIHRVEVLLLQPTVAMVVVITSNGSVTKRMYDFKAPLDRGLVEWASSYLNERLVGQSLGARTLAGRIRSPELSPAEAAFIAELSTAFDAIEADEDLYMDGAAKLLSEQRVGDLPAVESVMDALERRAGLLTALRSAIDERSVFVWVGEDNPDPELRSVSVVGANYGLGYRNLGTVGVVGPMRMDYATAIGSVREAAGQLSRFFETVYE